MPNVDYRIIIDVNSGTKKEKKKSEFQNLIVGFEVAKQVSKTVLGGISSRVGTLTGNTVLQAQINQGMQVAGMAAMVVANPLLGGFNALFSLGLMAIDRQLEVFWKNTEASEYRRRSGNYLSDRNR